MKRARRALSALFGVGYVVFVIRMFRAGGADTPENWFNIFAWIACLCLAALLWPWKDGS